MFRYFHFLIFLFTIHSSFSQESKKIFIEINSHLEKVKSFKGSFKLNFNDTRTFTQNKIEIENFETNVRGFHELFKYVTPLNIKTSQLKNKEININVDFFNFIESNSKKIILKVIATIEIDGGNYSNIKEKFTFSNENFTSLKFKTIKKKKESINQLAENFAKKNAKKIIEKIMEKTQKEESLVFEVTSIGFAKLNENLNKEVAKKKAISDALIKASEMAFGTKITSTTKIEDYGDISDILKTEAGSMVLNHSIIEGSIKYTSDNYCCLLIKSLIKKMKK